MSSSPILGSSPSSPRFSVFEVSRWSTTWFDEEEGVDSIFIWGNIFKSFFQPRPQEVTNSQSHDDHGYYHQLELCKSPWIGSHFGSDTDLSIPGSRFLFHLQVFHLHPGNMAGCSSLGARTSVGTRVRQHRLRRLLRGLLLDRRRRDGLCDTAFLHLRRQLI